VLRAIHGEDTRAKVDAIPCQAKQLTLAHTGVDGHDTQRPVGLTLGTVDQLLFGVLSGAERM
jgi:hypothetical protein